MTVCPGAIGCTGVFWPEVPELLPGALGPEVPEPLPDVLGPELLPDAGPLTPGPPLDAFWPWGLDLNWKSMSTFPLIPSMEPVLVACHM